jgi:ribonuclease HI
MDDDSILYELNTTRLVVKEPTNNKAELSAIRYVFKTILENMKLFTNKTVIICTDSMYSINCIEKWSKGWVKNNWKNAKGEDVKNQDIIKNTLTFKARINDSNNNIQIKFNHVFSHTQEPDDPTSLKHFLWKGNNTVDENIKKILDL